MAIREYPTKTEHKIEYWGHSINDRHYYESFLIPLKKKLYNVNFPLRKVRGQNSIKADISSSAIITFLNSVFGVPIGRKSQIVRVPALVRNGSRNCQLSFLRGISDTDFSITFKIKTRSNLHTYPVICAGFASRKLVEDLSSMLKNFGFKVVKIRRNRFDRRTGHTYNIYEIYLNGVGNLERWIDIIGFNNSNHTTKYLIWKKFGHCPPNKNVLERLKILNSKKDEVGHRRFELLTYRFPSA